MFAALRSRLPVFFFVFAICAVASHAQQTIDRIVARIENDIILLSDVRGLERYQQLVNGKSENDEQVLDRLIDQWIVRNEAETAHFPHPSEADVDRGVERVRQSFSSVEEYQSKRKQAGLSDAEVRSMVASQLYLTNYLDSRFRPAVQVSAKQIEDFYQQAVVPRAKERGQEAPTLDAARDYIQKALVEQGIDEQANRWLNESRGRVHVEKLLSDNSK